MPPGRSPRAPRARDPRLLRRSLGSALVALSMLGVAGVPAAHATFPGANGRIVFDTADSPDGSQIYTIEPDGSDLVQLTHLTDGGAFDPRWSANGRRIVYTRSEPGSDELWTMRWDGSHQQQITDEPDIGHYTPAFRPGGGIVFARCDFTSSGECSLSSVRRDGSHMRTIVGGYWHHVQPVVSPDGGWIVFVSDKGGYDGRMWMVHPDGTDLHRVGEPPALFADRPDWAPDGALITFTGNPVSAETHIIAPDGSGLEVIAPRLFAVYSPDGTEMAALDDPDCACRTLVATDPDGNELRTITSMPGVTHVDWGVAP